MHSIDIVMITDCISQNTWYFHRTTVKQGRVWHLGELAQLFREWGDKSYCNTIYSLAINFHITITMETTSNF